MDPPSEEQIAAMEADLAAMDGEMRETFKEVFVERMMDPEKKVTSYDAALFVAIAGGKTIREAVEVVMASPTVTLTIYDEVKPSPTVH